MSVVVVGQIGRDLVLRCAEVPESGGSAPVVERRELLGGKGANQAVGLAQLGVPVSLIGVVGDDPPGASVLRQASDDGIDTRGVAQRGDTALLVGVVDAPGSRRLLEDIPDSSLVTVDDLDRSAAVFDDADTVSLQLQQPPETVLTAARRAHERGARVVADGPKTPELLMSRVMRPAAAGPRRRAAQPVRSGRLVRTPDQRVGPCARSRGDNPESPPLNR
jgi:ribokinase